MRPFWWAMAKYLRVPSEKMQYRLAFEKWLCKWDYDNSPAVEDYNANARRFNSRALSKSSFGKPRMVKFYKIEIPVPYDAERFLENIFGDWKKMPPIEKQVPSHQLIR